MMHPNRPVFFHAFIIIGILCFLCVPVMATSEIEYAGDLRHLVSNSNLIFSGRVTQVDYSMPADDPGSVSVPYTIVTYTMDRVLLGHMREETNFSMRLLGGSDGQGGFLAIGGVPRFQLGDEDFLFVASNGEMGCPLVLCEGGRYRILNGRTYNYQGVPVRTINRTHLIASGKPISQFRTFSYPVPEFDDLLRNPEVQRLADELRDKSGISLQELRERYSKEAPRKITIVAVPSQRDATEDSTDLVVSNTTTELESESGTPRRAITVDEFALAVRALVQQYNPTVRPISSIDAKASVPVGITFQQRVPKLERPDPLADPSIDTGDEYDKLRAQDFNPVIRDK